MENSVEEKYDHLIGSHVEEAEKEGFRSMGICSGLGGYSLWDKKDNGFHYMLTVGNEIVRDSACHKE